MNTAARLGWVALCLIVARPVAAAEPSPDEERARRHFQEGRAAYDQKDYRRAIEAFTAARRVYPRPAFDFNIARAHDRLGDEAEALAAYERFAAAGEGGDEAREATERVTVLRARTAEARERRRRRQRLIIAGALGGGALIALATGGGLLGAAASRYATERDALCGALQNCGPARVDAIRGLDYAGKAMLGVGGALLAVDVGLWIWATRR